MSCAEGGSGGRGGRRSTNRSSPRSSRNEKFEPPPSPIRDARTGPLSEPVAVEERLDAVEDEKRLPRRAGGLGRGRDDVGGVRSRGDRATTAR